MIMIFFAVANMYVNKKTFPPQDFSSHEDQTQHLRRKKWTSNHHGPSS